MKERIAILFCAMLISPLIACVKKVDIPIATEDDEVDAAIQFRLNNRTN